MSKAFVYCKDAEIVAFCFMSYKCWSVFVFLFRDVSNSWVTTREDLSVQSELLHLLNTFNYTLIKKGKKIFLICRDIQKGSGAKSYMRKGFLMYEEVHKYLVIYEEAVSHTLHPIPSEFPYIWGKFNFFISVLLQT